MAQVRRRYSFNVEFGWGTMMLFFICAISLIGIPFAVLLLIDHLVVTQIDEEAPDGEV